MTALDPALVRRVREWLDAGAAGTAWLTGHPGSGLTTLVRELTRGMEAVWLTSATLRSRQFLRDVCSHHLAVSGKRKVLVLDELDVMLGNEAVMLDVAFAVKHNTTVPVVCILKSSRGAASCDLAKKAALVVHFPPPTHEAMVAAVTRVAAAEGLCLDGIEGLCRAAPGDIRHVLQTLRAGIGAVREITMQTADALAELLGGRGVDVVRALALFSADAGGLPSAVFETYWQSTQDVSQITAYLDMASAGDVVDECIHASHRWELLEVYGALTTASAATLLPPTPGVKLEKYGTLWNKNYAQCSKAKALKSIVACRASHGLAPLRAEDLAFVRTMVRSAITRSVEDAAGVCRLAGVDAPSCLHLMRLWPLGEYKLGTHTKLRKLL